MPSQNWHFSFLHLSKVEFTQGIWIETCTYHSSIRNQSIFKSEANVQQLFRSLFTEAGRSRCLKGISVARQEKGNEYYCSQQQFWLEKSRCVFNGTPWSHSLIELPGVDKDLFFLLSIRPCTIVWALVGRTLILTTLKPLPCLDEINQRVFMHPCASEWASKELLRQRMALWETVFTGCKDFLNYIKLYTSLSFLGA